MVFNDIIDQLTYNPEEPLLFLKGFFLFFMLIFSTGYAILYKRLNFRIIYVSIFSLYFYYKTSGFYFLLLVLLSFTDHSLGFFIHNSTNQRTRKLLLAASIAANLSILCYFKYTAMLGDMVNSIFQSNLEFSKIFLPIGISFFTFQSMSYTIDIYRKELKPLEKWIDYLFYLSFFPQLVAGPIVRARDFTPQITRNPIVISKEDFGKGVFLIICGLLKKGVISNYISLNFVDRVFDLPLLYSGFENLVGIYGYALQIYCDFSGYSDIAIGIALLLGFTFKDNFNSPYKALSITEFWKRWHISLSSWLKDYLYISMGGNRKGKFRTYINLMITMLLGGLWHGAAWRFIVWGAIHGVALCIHKFLMSKFPTLKKDKNEISHFRKAISILITFHIVCLGWVFFRADSFSTGVNMIKQIFVNFQGKIWLEFIIGYKNIVILLAIGYITHYVSDKRFKQLETYFKQTNLAAQTVALVVTIWVIMQISSGEIQPFIYFQF
ncbi:MAG: MBOAT family protein [Rikenellaceae bacterium]